MKPNDGTQSLVGIGNRKPFNDLQSPIRTIRIFRIRSDPIFIQSDIFPNVGRIRIFILVLGWILWMKILRTMQLLLSQISAITNLNRMLKRIHFLKFYFDQQTDFFDRSRLTNHARISDVGRIQIYQNNDSVAIAKPNK